MRGKIFTIITILFLIFTKAAVARASNPSPTFSSSFSGQITGSLPSFSLTAGSNAITGSGQASGTVSYDPSSNSFSGPITISQINGTLTGSGNAITYSGQGGSGSITFSGAAGSLSGFVSVSTEISNTVAAQCSDGSTPANGICANGSTPVCPNGYIYDSFNNECTGNAPVNFTLTGNGNSITASGDASGQITISAGYTCPSGYNYDSSNNTCVAIPQAGTTAEFYCFGGSSSDSSSSYQSCLSGTAFQNYNNDTQLCPLGQTQCNENTATPSCPSGYTLSGGTCVSTVSAVISCPSGYTYNSSSGQCIGTTTTTTNPTVSGGENSSNVGNGFGALTGITGSGNTLTVYWTNVFGTSNGSFNITLSGATLSGGENLYFNMSGSNGNYYCPELNGITGSGNTLTVHWYNGCQSTSGSFNITLSGATVSGSGGDNSGSNGALTGITGSGNTLTVDVDWGSSGSSFNITLLGVSQATTSMTSPSYSCPSGYTLSGNTCISTVSATCSSGSTLSGSECISYACPLSGTPQGSSPAQNYVCIEPSGSSNYYCSPNVCYNDTTNTPVTTTETLPPPQTNNGTVTSSGCSGSVYLFPGTAMQCRSGGVQTFGQDCCNANSYLFGLLNCNTTEKTLAQDLDYDTNYGANGYTNPNLYGGSGNSQYVGSYCSYNFFGTCLETMKVYCVFHSLLALIVQEQGRAELGLNFGSPQNPNCSGLTPTQFQELNFSNFDFTEYITVIESKIKAGVINPSIASQVPGVQQTITNQVTNYEQELTGANP
ncbi:MAG: conjugal transfer protein TraN [Deltaproteobacteria bacterium]|nr:conjugal transfer protein TraN [Deltaproteobacteria bacterium]